MLCRLLGWSQEEIGQLHGITQQGVAKATTELNKFKSVVISDFFEKKKVSEISDFFCAFWKVSCSPQLRNMLGSEGQR